MLLAGLILSVKAEKGAPASAVRGVNVGQTGTICIMQIGLPLPHPATPNRTLVQQSKEYSWSRAPPN